MISISSRKACYTTSPQTYLLVSDISIPLLTGNGQTGFTFFGEKFLGVFPCYNELARHLPQELYDQGDVVCGDRAGQGQQKWLYSQQRERCTHCSVRPCTARLLSDLKQKKRTVSLMQGPFPRQHLSPLQEEISAE